MAATRRMSQGSKLQWETRPIGTGRLQDVPPRKFQVRTKHKHRPAAEQQLPLHLYCWQDLEQVLFALAGTVWRAMLVLKRTVLEKRTCATSSKYALPASSLEDSAQH